MSTQLAEAVIGSTADLFGGAPALAEVPEPTPPDEPADDDLDLAPAADLTDLFGDEEFEDTGEIAPQFDELTEDELRAELTKAARKVEHERRLRVQTGVKQWRSEATEKFPYSTPGEITAESRKDFLRQAQAQDQAARKILAPFIEKAKLREQNIEARLREEIRKDFEQSWGTPTLGGGPGAAPIHSDATTRLGEARRKRSLVGAVKALADGGSF